MVLATPPPHSRHPHCAAQHRRCAVTTQADEALQESNGLTALRFQFQKHKSLPATGSELHKACGSTPAAAACADHCPAAHWFSWADVNAPAPKLKQDRVLKQNPCHVFRTAHDSAKEPGRLDTRGLSPTCIGVPLRQPIPALRAAPIPFCVCWVMAPQLAPWLLLANPFSAAATNGPAHGIL